MGASSRSESAASFVCWILEQVGARGLYSPVALASHHERSSLVRGVQVGRELGRALPGPSARGLFRERSWRSEATRPVDPAEWSLKTEQRVMRDTRPSL